MNRNDDLLNIALKTEQAGCRKEDTQCCGKCSNSSIENQREKLASENGMAIEFVNWFFDNKKDGCGNAWFIMMAAMWEGWTAREAQVKQLAAERDAVVAENAALKAFGDKLYSMYKGLETSGGGFHDDQSISYQQAALDAAMSAFEEIETPATDAAIASLRAEGVEMFAEHLKDKYEGIEYSLIGEYYTDGEEDRVSDQGEIDCALSFAAQLRSKSEVRS